MRFALSGQLANLLHRDEVIVLAPSGFLAAVISQDFADAKLKAGVESWRRPIVTTPAAWLAERWRESRYLSGSSDILLSNSQDHLLWRNVIEANHRRLFDLNAAARLASQASLTMAEWQIPDEGAAWTEHPDASQFLEWRRRLREICQREGWLLRADLWNLSWFKAESLPRQRIVFAGFTTMSPAVRDLRRRLASRVVDVQAEQPSRRVAVASHRCESFSQEIEYAARWARLRFEQHPAASVGVLVPSLAEHSSLVKRTFRSVFYPSPVMREDSAGCVFHVSASGSLRDEPVIANALLLCKLALGLITQPDAGAILRSPFLPGARQERSQRALADLRLRKRRELDCSLDDLQNAAQHCPVLSKLLTRVEHMLSSNSPHEAEIAEWSSFISELLAATGWPGDTELLTKEREALDGWKDALSQLASLELVAGPMPLDVALGHLKRLLLRPGSATGDILSPIQILDWTQAPSLSFDSAFIAGLSEVSRHPVSPLIPISLQRAAGVTGSSPTSVEAERRALTEALFGCARTISATYSGTRVSAIAEPFVTEGKRVAQWRGRMPWETFKPAGFDLMEDTWAPAFPNPQAATGGTRLIKSQSSCPFQAFATFRLRADTPEDACFGFNHLERGGFVHDALKSIWEQLSSQQELAAMPGEDMEALVENAVHDAVAKSEPQARSVGDISGWPSPSHRSSVTQECPPSAPSAHQLLSDVERQRLQIVILDWLRYEIARKIPFVVEAVEEEQTFNLAGLSLKLRIDRIDRLPNGKYVLIDYKSGEPKQATLLGDRPSEPQLLVYAALLGQQVDGLFFGQLKPRDAKLVGFSRDVHFTVKGAKKTVPWDDFLNSSIQHVEEFAREYLQGFAAVDPIKGACNYCPQKPFCRIQEKGGGSEGEDSE